MVAAGEGAQASPCRDPSGLPFVRIPKENLSGFGEASLVILYAALEVSL